MKKFKWIILILVCLFVFPACYETKKQAYAEKRGLMLLEPHEIPRNKILKFNKSKVKKDLHKRIQHELKRQRRHRR